MPNSNRPENILAAASHADPYPWYAELVSGSPLLRDEARSLWIASSAMAVHAVMADPACRVRPVAEPVPAAIAGSAAGDVFGYLVRMNDGVRHDAPKLALQRFLADVDLARVAARTVAIAQFEAPGYKSQAAGLSAWVLDVPVMAAADLLGFEEAALPQVARWVGDFVACLSPVSTPAQLAAASEAAGALLERFAELVRRARPADGSAVSRVQHEASMAGWNDAAALLANLVGLLSQTYEATAGLLGNSIVAITREPGLRDAAADPAVRLQLVHEVSRHDPAIHNTRRFVAQSTDIAGVQLQPGDTVLLVLAAASRDPACNPRPAQFLISRSQRVVPGFGHAAHQCPGQALACTMASAALGHWLASGPVPSHWHYRASANARLPVFTG